MGKDGRVTRHVKGGKRTSGQTGGGGHPYPGSDQRLGWPLARKQKQTNNVVEVNMLLMMMMMMMLDGCKYENYRLPAITRHSGGRVAVCVLYTVQCSPIRRGAFLRQPPCSGRRRWHLTFQR